MGYTSILVSGFLLAAQPTPEQMEKQLANSPGAGMPAVQDAMKKMKEYQDMMKDAQSQKNNKAKTCEQKCELLDKESESATEHEKVLPNGKKVPDSVRERMKKNNKAIAQACKESCEKKGKIDKDYLKEHMPKAERPPASYGGG